MSITTATTFNAYFNRGIVASQWVSRRLGISPNNLQSKKLETVINTPNDPFGDNPVLLTGSHNLGPKASGKNDEDLLIIRNASGLAVAYAVNIMAIYNQYRWRFRRHAQPKSKRWKGLQDTDTWQKGYLKPGSQALREINFWAGV